MRCFMSNKECDHYPPKEEEILKKVFMISPFDYPFDEIFESGIKIATEMEEKEISRADQAIQLGYVMCQRICRKIIESEYVIVDVSLPNANVYYELGLSYSLEKKIIFIANQKYKNKYRFNLNQDLPYFILYSGVSDFTTPPKKRIEAEGSIESDAGGHKMDPEECRMKCSEKLRQAFENYYQINKKLYQTAKDRSSYFNNNKIVTFENNNAPLTDLHINTLIEIRCLEQKSIDSDNSANQPNNEDPELAERLSNWEIHKFEITEGLEIDTIVEQIRDTNICLIDTTHYNDEINPYVYFCLGLAHGFEREVIPITNSRMETKFPFDTRGLWHVFYSKETELKERLIEILPSILDELDLEKNRFMIRQMWDPFLHKRDIRIFTCARNDETNTDKRGKRTNIDKCDYKSVTDLTYFIVQNYPTAIFYFSEPASKKNLYEIENLNLSLGFVSPQSA